MEIINSVRSWGNGAGVLVPKDWEGKQVRITLMDRTPEIRAEIFKILDKYLYDIIGIYLVGSYARNEQTAESDIDVIAVSNNVKKEIISGKYHISVYPLESVKKTMKNFPVMIYPRILEARPILNENLLNQLKSIKISRDKFKEFLEDTQRIININRGLIELDSEDEYLSSNGVIYSLILRLRAIFIIKSMLSKKKYFNQLFKKWLVQNIGKENSEKFYLIYNSVKDNKKVKIKVKISESEKLLDFLEKETKWLKEKKDWKKE